MIDKQLANYYGIDGVRESRWVQESSDQAEQHRGGVLGMAGVLTYLTDGFRTLPVRRAAYVKDVLWNEPAKPPPPNVGDLPAVKAEPDRPAAPPGTSRFGQLRKLPRHLDPFGIALENYDAIGKWRERQNGEGFRGDDKSPPLDVSGALPSGRDVQQPCGIQAGAAGRKRPFRPRLHEKDAHLCPGPLGRGNRPGDRGWDRARRSNGTIIECNRWCRLLWPVRPFE